MKSSQKSVLVTGAAGMLGSQVLLSVPDGITVVGTDLREAAGVEAVGIDLADPAQVERLFREAGPFAGVIHAAAYTAVDRAEEEETVAQRANADACGVLAAACAGAEIPVVLVGTDFVFDGEARRPYREDDATHPISAYGRTKLAGERLAQEAHPDGARIVRTQWLYGPRGKHFPSTIRSLARERDEIKVVCDQIGVPTSTLELSPALWDVLLKGERGIYHAACEGECSWFEFAQAVLQASASDKTRVEPCTTEEFPRPARRPAYSVLDSARLAALRGRTLSSWRDALSTFLGRSEDS